MTSSRDAQWQHVRDVEDMLALVNAIDVRRRCIRAHAWHGRNAASLDRIFDEATAMAAEIHILRTELGAVWKDLYEQIGLKKC